MMTKTSIEMWLENGTPQLRVHADKKRSFDAVRNDLIVMRERLSREINDGPTKCPYFGRPPVRAGF